MRHLIASIYISFGFLFYFLTFFGDYYPSKIVGFVSFVFIFLGFGYLFKEYKERIKKTF